MLSKLKKGVKWIMEKKNEIIDNSLAVRAYEDTKEGLRTVLSSETNTRKAAVVLTGSALGIAIGITIGAIGLFISTYVR